MKKILSCAAIAAAIVLSGCGGKAEPEQAECEINGQEAPQWVCNPYLDDKTIAGLGAAKKNAGNDFIHQRNEAQAAGRDEIARNIAVHVRNAFDSWKRSTGAGEDATFEQNVESVSRQTANIDLKGAKQAKMWQAKDGSVFILMVAPMDQAQAKMMSSLRNENALWQQFSSAQAQQKLKEEFEKSVAQPTTAPAAR